MQWPISWFDVKDHIDDIEDGINPELLPKGGFGYTDNDGTTILSTTDFERVVDEEEFSFLSRYLQPQAMSKSKKA